MEYVVVCGQFVYEFLQFVVVRVVFCFGVYDCDVYFCEMVLVWVEVVGGWIEELEVCEVGGVVVFVVYVCVEGVVEGVCCDQVGLGVVYYGDFVGECVQCLVQVGLCCWVFCGLVLLQLF